MSVETPIVAEAPVAVKPVPAAEPIETTASTAVAESAEKVDPSAVPNTTLGNTEGVAGTSTEQPLEDNKVAITATPASEGILGYKAPGFLKSFVFSKQFFWLSDEASTSECLAGYVSNTKADGHHHAAWAQETGTGVLFHSKRAEDKSAPAGVILLADATNLTKDGTTEFSFFTGKKHHKFEAQTTAERDSWIVAIEKAIEESKAVKDEIVGRESYKHSLSTYAAASLGAAAASKAERSTSKGPEKALETTPTPVAASEPVPVDGTAAAAASEKDAKKPEKAAKKERSQSRKRASIFGILGKKDEEKEAKKEEKAEKKAEKEHEKEVKKEQKEHIKEEKEAEAEAKKEEAKATHDSSKVVEAAKAAAVAAVPALAIAAEKEEEEKKEAPVTDAAATEKKNKRGSVFGSLFGKKNVTSPTTEKSEEHATSTTPVVAAEIPPVSETAPKLDEPIETKPIDAAAVTATVDAVIEAPAAAHHAVTVDPEVPAQTTTTPVAETAPTPKSEKKSGFLGFMKKAEAKKEEKKEERAEKKAEKEAKKELKKEEKELAKEEKAAAEITKDPVAAASTDATTEAVVEAPVAAAETSADERPAREKRHSSFFGSLAGKKRTTEATETDAAPVETKRERSPLPAKLGGLFRKPSKTVKPAEIPAVTSEATEASKVEAPAVAATTSDPLAKATIVEPSESKIVGDVVPEELHTNLEGAAAPSSEVKTSA